MYTHYTHHPTVAGRAVVDGQFCCPALPCAHCVVCVQSCAPASAACCDDLQTTHMVVHTQVIHLICSTVHVLEQRQYTFGWFILPWPSTARSRGLLCSGDEIPTHHNSDLVHILITFHTLETCLCLPLPYPL